MSRLLCPIRNLSSAGRRAGFPPTALNFILVSTSRRETNYTLIKQLTRSSSKEQRVNARKTKFPHNPKKSAPNKLFDLLETQINWQQIGLSKTLSAFGTNKLRLSAKRAGKHAKLAPVSLFSALT
jgi:hypothetical protein